MTPRALFYLLAANVIGGTSYVAGAYALRGLSPVGLAFWRLAIGALFFLPFAVSGVRRARPSPRDWLGMAGVGVLGLAAPLLIGNLGLRLSTATNAALLIGAEPLSVVILSALFLGEALTAFKAAAIGCGIAGSALIVMQGPPWSAPLTPHWRGDLLLLTHGFFFALYSVIGKPVLRRVDQLTFSAVSTLFALPVLGLAAWLEGFALPTRSFGALAYLAIVVTIGGVLTWNAALQLVPASVLANFIFMQPLIGVALGMLLQHDAFTAWSASGGALILAGVYLAAR